jgi:hypothetical protein
MELKESKMRFAEDIMEHAEFKILVSVKEQQLVKHEDDEADMCEYSIIFKAYVQIYDDPEIAVSIIDKFTIILPKRDNLLELSSAEKERMIYFVRNIVHTMYLYKYNRAEELARFRASSIYAPISILISDLHQQDFRFFNKLRVIPSAPETNE